MVKVSKRRVFWLLVSAVIAGVLGSSAMRIAFHFDPMVLIARQAVVDDRTVRQLIGEIQLDDVSVYRTLKTGDQSREFAREEYSASVAGSIRRALLTVLIRKSNANGGVVGKPEVVDIKVRD